MFPLGLPALSHLQCIAAPSTGSRRTQYFHENTYHSIHWFQHNRCPMDCTAPGGSSDQQSVFFFYLLHKNFINKKIIFFFRRCKLRSKISLFFSLHKELNPHSPLTLSLYPSPGPVRPLQRCPVDRRPRLATDCPTTGDRGAALTLVRLE